MSLDILADPVTNPVGFPLMDSSDPAGTDPASENVSKMEVDVADVQTEKVTESSVKLEQNFQDLDRTTNVIATSITEDSTVAERKDQPADQPPVAETKQELFVFTENGELDKQKSIITSEATDEKIRGETSTVIPLNDNSAVRPISSTSEIPAATSSTNASDTIALTAPEAQPQSPLQPTHAQPVPFSKLEVPSLLLRMGPPIADSDTPTSLALPIDAPASPRKVLSQRPLPDRSLMDRPLVDKPRVDTWFPEEVVRAFQAKNATDTYIAPPSPPTLRSSRTANPSNKRRLERSPSRTRYEDDKNRYRRNSHTTEERPRASTRRSSWRDEHLPNKRYKAETEDHVESRHAESRNAESRYVESKYVARGDSWQPRYDDRTDLPVSNGRAHHDDYRSRHGRSPSVDRRSDWSTHGALDRERYHRGDRNRSPSVERKSDWGTRVASDRGRDHRGGGTGEGHMHRNDTRETNGYRDTRHGHGEHSARELREKDNRISERKDDGYNRKSDEHSRTREYVEAQRQPTRQNHPNHRTADTADRPPRSGGVESSGWDRSSSKRYEGGRAESARSSHHSPSRQNGKETVLVSAPIGSTSTNHRTPNEAGWEKPAANAARSPPPKVQQQIPTGPKPSSSQQPAPVQAPVGYATAPRNNPVTTGGWPRAAVNGANSVPLTTRRGYDLPKATPPTGPSRTAPSLHHHMPKDTLAPPLQDKEYILAKYAAQKHLVKSVWIDNPKAPVANFLTGGKGGANGLGPRGPAYRVAMGRLGGVNIARATLPIRGHPSIAGTGDDPLRVQAEKLACLSALFQLAEAGLVKCEEQPVGEPVVESVDIDDADSEEVTQLSTGETITLRDARAFMDYYCTRFGFGQPEISYETVAMRAGPQKWEAIMEVGGKKIGLGAGTTKKMATRVCYLDVTSYLEKCDQELWKEYVQHAKGQATQG
ncbi:hypothetical protein QFC22_002312 [Naganishia vaughanmartiniae]|uniref:Uncharacterized protein n=1 Tax=Naganishia vaughanmartiniae TaxID=1424756 RepID=A0ACC2XEK6_9TREE|nr:hypothetical protein QFC22_002312 [Naganishia vaughanmartiniae]